MRLHRTYRIMLDASWWKLTTTAHAQLPCRSNPTPTTHPHSAPPVGPCPNRTPSVYTDKFPLPCLHELVPITLLCHMLEELPSTASCYTPTLSTPRTDRSSWERTNHQRAPCRSPPPPAPRPPNPDPRPPAPEPRPPAPEPRPQSVVQPPTPPQPHLQVVQGAHEGAVQHVQAVRLSGPVVVGEGHMG